MKIKGILSLIFAALIVSACGGSPAANTMLTRAQDVFRTAENDPVVVSNAPVALQEAEEALRETERLWQEKAKKEEVDHHAYVALQRVLIAQETAKLNKAEKDVERAEVERKEVLLEVRTREARLAEANANEARREAEAAVARAEQLATKLTELEARKTTRGIVLTLSDVLFDVGKADLKASSMDMMMQLAQYLQEYPDRTVMIEGFTDSSGSAAFNMDLSMRRAQSVRDALVLRNVTSDRIRIRGFGEKFPVASNNTAYGRQQNRRVEIIISDEAGVITERTH